MEEVKRDSLVFYRSFYEALKEVDNDTKAMVYDAIFEYSLNFNEVDLKGTAKAMFTLIKPQLDANNQRFKNGNKGGRPKKDNPKDNQTITKTKPNNNQNETKPKANVNDNVNVNDNKNVNKDIVPYGTDLIIDFTLEVDLDKFSLYEKTAIGFFKLIKTNLQNNGQNNFNTYDKSKLSVWSNQIRLMVEQDKRQMSEIREIYAFLNNGIGAEFWQRTAQSMNSIRKSFDKIYLEAKRSEKEKKKETTSSGINYNIVQ